MTIQQAIEKAIEGGWPTKDCSNCLNPWTGHKQTRIGNRYCTRLPDMNKAFLDPLFWQSLGKAMGDSFQDENTQMLWEKSGGAGLVPAGTLKWAKRWHRFIDHLIEGKDAESFFETL